MNLAEKPSLISLEEINLLSIVVQIEEHRAIIILQGNPNHVLVRIMVIVALLETRV